MARKKAWAGEERRAPALVLVVGDQEDSNELLCRVLESRGYRATRATTPEEALQRLAQALPRVAVLDLTAGGIGSNLNLLESIRSHPDPRLSVTRVVMVARSAKNRVFSYQLGADDFLVRPFHANELIEAVGSSLSRAQDERAEVRRSVLEAR